MIFLILGQTQTQPQKTEPKSTLTLDFNNKTRKYMGNVPKMLIPEPDRPRKVDPEPNPTPTFAP